MSASKYAVPESYFQIVSPLDATPVVDAETPANTNQNSKQVTFKGRQRRSKNTGPAITPVQVILCRNSIIDYVDRHMKKDD